MQDNVYWSERIGSGRIETVIVATAVNDEWNNDDGGSGWIRKMHTFSGTPSQINQSADDDDGTVEILSFSEFTEMGK